MLQGPAPRSKTLKGLAKGLDEHLTRYPNVVRFLFPKDIYIVQADLLVCILFYASSLYLLFVILSCIF